VAGSHGICYGMAMRFPRLKWLPLLAAAVFSANAQDLPRLRDGGSPDQKFDACLSMEGGKLRFKILVRETGKTLGDIPSAYDAVQATVPNAAELARKTVAYWSPDSRYVVLREPETSSAKSEMILVSVQPDAVKRIPVDLKKIQALSPKEHENWSLEFKDWLGNRTFLVRFHGMTFHSDRANEHDIIPIICRIRKDGEMTMVNANE
jgi:hypothetical protein